MLNLIGLLAIAQVSLAQMDMSTCGTSKGCLFAPMGCNSAAGNCEISFSYVQSGSDMIMELQGNAPSGGYLAVGFSHDTSMGNDSVSACYDNNVLLAYNEGKRVINLNQPGQQNLQAYTTANGQMYCRIRRSISGNGNAQVFNLNDPYTIFLAYGPMNNGAVGYHQRNKWIMPRTEMSAYNAANPSMPADDDDSAANRVPTSPVPTSPAPADTTTTTTPPSTTAGSSACTLILSCILSLVAAKWTLA